MGGHYRPRFTVTLKCEWCTGEFQATRKDARTCKPACRQAAKRASTGRKDRPNYDPNNTRNRVDLSLWNRYWQALLAEGKVEPKGSKQYGRITDDWLASDCPPKIRAFILARVGG